MTSSNLFIGVLFRLMVVAALAGVLAACGGPAATATPTPEPEPTPPGQNGEPVNGPPDVSFTLETHTGVGDVVFGFVGRGGEIDGVINPTLRVEEGQIVEIVLINRDGVEHDLVIPELGVHSEHIHLEGDTTTVLFRAHLQGEFAYSCNIPGHRQAGMEGRLVVGAEVEREPAASIVRNPADLPGPIGDREPATVHVELEAVELEGRLADGTTYTYWTFDGTVPGPFIRVREGDTVEVRLTNRSDSTAVHSIDFHAATGYLGGGQVSQIAPGEEAVFSFRALNPGLYVYHCATPSVAHHIASGMYGLILVEPAGGLPEVDREFYVMQGELYTEQPHGSAGHLTFSHEKMLREQPEYFVYNGAVGALTEEYPLRAQVGETVRIFYGVGGPNFISSFHVIGEIFDRVYDQGSLTAPPLTDVQTTLVPAGGATMVEFALEVPGSYILVDHALSRAERGLVGFLDVEGPEDPSVFRPGPSE